MFTLGRKIDIHYPTNKLILAITVLAAAIGVFTTGDFVTSLKIGGTIFLTWALSRELDPKREYGAFISVAFSFYIFFVSFEITLMEVFFFMLSLRLLSTTCGKQPTWFDALTVTGIAGYLSYTTTNPVYILLAVIGVFLSGALRSIMLLYRILTLVVGGALGYLLSMFFVDATFEMPIFSFTFIFIVTLIYSLLAYLDFKKDITIYDDQNNTISSSKILKSQLFFAGSFLIISLFADQTTGNIILYTASMSGLILYNIIAKLANLEK